METSSQDCSTEEILTTIGQLAYRNYKAIEELTEEASQANLLLKQIDRRSWVQNIVAWIQLITVFFVILVYVLLLIGDLGLPPLLRLLQ